MYYFERARWGAFLFYKENGLPVFFGERRFSRRKIVWWMPTNWIAVTYLLILAPLTLSVIAYRAKKGQPHD